MMYALWQPCPRSALVAALPQLSHDALHATNDALHATDDALHAINPKCKA